ncbi:S9 family peptidase [Nakamurella flava]|uniref:prolyl oligopeptidase n=1 Tax=Nakamurella flava TaxID=2576308 RepID=A0A4U6QKB6_9ACTN|nr:prolyl oligopeptidase family serine peptidase [Nakamurella flava]TKV60893.1 S9 family peptidase [Nakamurella flava]
MTEHAPADRDRIVDVLHGVEIADPYRYLEDPDDPRTQAFVQAQNAVSRPHLAGLAAGPAFRQLTTTLLTAPRRGVPWERGGRYFVVANPGDLDQDQLFTADSLDDLLTAPRLLLDPNTLSTDGTVALTAARVSPDGALLAYALSEGGSDWQSIAVRDIATGLDRPDRLTWAKWVAPTWLPDSSGFLYWRYPAPATAANDGAVGSAALTEAMPAGELVHHRLGDDQDADTLVWSDPEHPEWMAGPWVAPDGRWLVLTTSPGTDSRTTISAHRLTTPPDGTPVAIDPSPVVVVGELADAHTVVGSDGDQLFLRTERDAPRGRLVRVDLADPDAPWTGLVDQHEQDVLVDASPTAEAFVLTWSSDAAHRIELVDRDGASLTWPDLPAPVAVLAVNTRANSPEIFVGLGSFTAFSRQYRLDATTGYQPELLAPPGDRPDLPETVVQRRSGRSADGTAVPMTVIRRADLPAGPSPTLLYGYGGFDVPILPGFSALFGAWVAAGGTLAVANLRGGGEFGADWHTAGMLHHKQRVFDDLYACAEALIADGTTTPEQLAVHGRSNGGLLVGAAMTQRPELFAVALPTVGVLDMLRFHLFTIGWAWMSEYGSPDDPDDFAVLHAYSPLHRLREGTRYPATLICTGDHDDRVVPAHSLKFGAELQRCQAGPGPVLLRIDTRAGHGAGKPVSALAEEHADQLAFAAEYTGLVPRG